MEALEPHIYILPPNWTSSNSNSNKHEGVCVRPSTSQAQVLVQLRPGDQFIVASRRFSLTISEPDPARFTPSVSEHSTVVDLEQEEVDNANANLDLNSDGNNDPAAASASHPSLPGDEIDMLGSPYINASHHPDKVLSLSGSNRSDVDFGQLQTVTTGGQPHCSTESEDRVDQNPAVIGGKISPTKTAAEQPQNHLATEEEMQEQNGGPHSDEASSVASNEEAAELAHDVPSSGNGSSPEGNRTEVEVLPIDAASLALAQSKDERSPAPAATEVTYPRTLSCPLIPGEHKLQGNDETTSSVLTQPGARPMAEPQGVQQTTFHQPPPKTAQSVSDVQATEHHNTHSVNLSIPPSTPKISTPSTRHASAAISVAKAGAQSPFAQAPAEASSLLPQVQDDVDTQTSTIDRVDGFLQLAGIKSDPTNSDSSPGKVTMKSDMEIRSKARRQFKPRTNLAAVGEEFTESDGELDSPTPASFSARGRSLVVQSSKLKGSAKRKLKSFERDPSPRLKTYGKRRKIQDEESSMESTVEVRPLSSRRNAMIPSQTSKRQSRGISTTSQTPSFSTPSHRIPRSQETSTDRYSGPPPRVLFSSNSTVDEKPLLMAFLTRQGGRQVETVKECNILCVGPGELKKTSKLLLAVASGKDIVRDKWLVDSARQRRLIDLRPYLAEDSDREAEWGTKLADAIARGKAGTKPFAGWTMWFTPTLKKELGNGFLELTEVALLAGASAVHAKLPSKGADPQANMLVLASPKDKDATTLAEAGWTCCSKDVISLSVLRGRLITENFKLDLQPSAVEVKSSGKRRKR